MSEPVGEMKKCPYCGRMTSAAANFCYYCARELVARPERPEVEEPPSRINWWVVVIVLAATAFILLFVFAR